MFVVPHCSICFSTSYKRPGVVHQEVDQEQPVSSQMKSISKSLAHEHLNRARIEAFDRILLDLQSRFPGLIAVDGRTDSVSTDDVPNKVVFKSIRNLVTGRTFTNVVADDLLQIAGHLVQEDLLLLLPGGEIEDYVSGETGYMGKMDQDHTAGLYHVSEKILLVKHIILEIHYTHERQHGCIVTFTSRSPPATRKFGRTSPPQEYQVAPQIIVSSRVPSISQTIGCSPTNLENPYTRSTIPSPITRRPSRRLSIPSSNG